MRPNAAILDQIGLVGGDDQVAAGDRLDAFRADARWQELCECRRGAIEFVDADQRGALGHHEELGRVAEAREFHAFGLDALVAAARLRVVAGLDRGPLEAGAVLVDHRSVAGEDREAAGAALVVTLVGDGDMVRVDPLDRVGLAQAAGLAAGEDQGAFLLGVDALEIDGTGRKVREHASVGAEDDDVIVFLKRDSDFAGGVDVDELRFGVFRGDVRKAGDVGPDESVALHLAVGERHDGDEAGRKLRDDAIIQILVALVLDGDGHEVAVRGDRNAVGLAAEVAGAGLAAARDVDGGQTSRGGS